MSLASHSQSTRHALRTTSILSPHHRPVVLGVLLLLTCLAYVRGLVLPYNLLTLGIRPLLNIAKLTQGDPALQAGFVLTFAVLSGLYYLAWRLCRGVQSRIGWILLVAGTLTINGAMLWLYPIDAADLFDNIARGRLTAVHGGNPFYNTPADYSRDPFYSFTAWRRSTSAYGPLWELLAAALSRVVGDDKLASILSFKLLGVAFYIGCIALIAATLNRRAPERALQGACLFALNPLVLYETAGNGHNDIAMTFFILLGIYALARDRFAWAALAVTAGALVKFVSILLLPIVVVAGFRSLAGWKARFHFLIITIASCLALVIAAYAPFWKGGDPLAIERRAGLFTASLPAVAQAQLEGALGVDESRRVVQQAALALTGLAVGAALWRTWVETPARLGCRGRFARPCALTNSGGGEAWLVPIRVSAFVLLFYLLFTCLWFQPWYALWPLALAAILPEGETGRIAVLLSYTAMWRTAIFDFFLYHGGPLPPRAWRETLLGPTTLGVVWLYGTYALFLRLRPRLINLKSQISNRQP